MITDNLSGCIIELKGIVSRYNMGTESMATTSIAVECTGVCKYRVRAAQRLYVEGYMPGGSTFSLVRPSLIDTTTPTL